MIAGVGDNPTLSDFLRSVYVPSRLEISDGAVEQIEAAIAVAERWAGRPLRVDDLTEDMLRGFLSDYRASRAAATVNSKRRHLLSLWQCAWEEGLLPSPPKRRKIRTARAEPRIPEAWTAEEIGRILESASQEPQAAWWRSLILVAYDTGERIGAILATTPGDIDPDRGYIVFRRTKNGQPRWCPLAQDTLAECRRLLGAPRERLWHWPYRREALYRRFRRICERAGVPVGWGQGSLFQRLRRSTASLIAAAGGNPSAHIGNTEAVCRRHYLDPRFQSNQLGLLPRPT